MPKHLTFGEIETRFAEKGFTLLSEAYEGASVKLRYRCHCGNESEITLGALLKQKGCGACSIERKIQTCSEIEHHRARLLPYEEVYNRFAEHGHILQTEMYTGDTQKLEYICKCGNRAITDMNSFRRNSTGCKTCTEEVRKMKCREKMEQTVEKCKETCIERYNVDNVSKIPEVKQKISAATKARYEEKPERYKARLESKTYTFTFPSGRTTKIRSRERFALELLLEEYSEDLINVEYDETVTPISFVFKGKQCWFYPSFSIKGTNKIFEVKSPGWYEKSHERNAVKFDACLQQGYDYELWSFDAKGEMIMMVYGD